MNIQSNEDTVPPIAELTRMQAVFARQREACARAPMPTLAQRKRSLVMLRALLLEHADAIVAAINADFTARSKDETLLAEVMPCLHHIAYTLKRLDRWMRPDRRSIGLHFLPASARVAYQPLGVVGIMVPFNFPLSLAVIPLITALASGNRAMIKMSEYTPGTAALIARMLGKAFTEEQVAVITGGVEIASAFSALPFDYLLFTGSTAVGRQVMHKAADNLTPVTLELGGKSPVIIADDIPLTDIVDRLCYAKSLNAGQSCIAPDYVLVPRAKIETFIRLYRDAFRKMFPAVNGNPDYTSIIDARSHARLQEWLRDAAAKGARIDRVSEELIDDGTFRMALHIVTQVTDEMRIMQQELFGPILPLVPYDDIEQALAYVRQRPRPLALYLFSYDRALQERVTYETHAGSMCINEAVIQFAVSDLPFGGVGPSGMGRYHGHEGFLSMSQPKSLLSNGRFNAMRFIYPPYGGTIQSWLRRWLMR